MALSHNTENTFDGILIYKVGEIKYIPLTVAPRNELETLVINSATFELRDYKGTVVDSGDCEVSSDKPCSNDKHIDALVHANAAGDYIYEAVISIGPEIYKPRIRVRVYE